MTPTKNYPWIAKIDEAIASLDEKPLFKGFSFPLEELEKQLGAALEKKHLRLSLLSQKWCLANESQAKSGSFYCLELSVSPLSAPVFLAMSQADIATLMGVLMGGGEELAPFLEKKYVVSFFQYLGIETCRLASDLPGLENFQLKVGKLIDFSSVVKEPSFEVVAEIAIENKKSSALLYFSKTFKEEFNKSAVFAQRSWKQNASIQKLPIELSLEVGRMNLKLEELKQLNVGDFLHLDQCFFDPNEKKGRLIVSLNKHPLFRAKVVEEGIKLLDYPLYDQGEKSMNFNDEEEDEEDLFENFALDDDDDDSLMEGNQEEEEPNREQKATSSKKQTTQFQKEMSTEPLSDVSLQMSVEVGRVRMTVAELGDLAPGNVIEIPASIDQGVNLVINGKKVGSGELIKLGEMLGVRITSL